MTALLRQVNQNFRVFYYVTELEFDSQLVVKLRQFMAERGDVRFEYIEEKPVVSDEGLGIGGVGIEMIVLIMMIVKMKR